MSDKKSIVVRASIWYTVASLFLKGMGVIVAPIYTRIMTTEEFGTYGNFTTWLGLFTIVATFSLYGSQIRARHDFEDDYDTYCKTIALLGTVITAVCMVVVLFNLERVSNLIGVSKIHVIIIFASLLVSPAHTIYLSVLQYSYKYKHYALISVLIAILETGTSLLLVLLWSDKVMARVIGNLGPLTLVSLVLYLIILSKKGTPQIRYVKYALTLSAPIVVHLLSNILLAQSDRIMIFQIRGAEETAIYTLAYSVSTIITLLWSSMNNAISPFVGDCLKEKNFTTTQKITVPYVFLFVIPVVFAMLIAPEIIWIFGGEKYQASINNIPPIFLGCIFQFLYSLYVNIEQYEKKNIWMAVGTVSAAVINIVLNFIFIPIFGQVAAAYTTATGYAFLLLFHYLIVRGMKMSRVYNNVAILLAVVISTIGMIICEFLYEAALVRLVAIGVSVVLAMIVICMKRKKVISFAKQVLKK